MTKTQGSTRFVPREEWVPAAIAEEAEQRRKAQDEARAQREENARRSRDQKDERAWLRKYWRKYLARKI